ncbi:MAG TPA: GNAT family N-acetyltransferase, partial [Bacteroidales bacterium]|nr:GNAT family N-acetyltransferase [Bacteroidales bacterium]
MKAPALESPRLMYKPLGLGHCTDQYVGWLNDPEVYRYLETGGNYTLDMLRDYLEGVERTEILFWAIHLKENGKHIGNIKIDPVNWKHGFAEYGIMMGERAEWGKGYAHEATRRILDFCFQEVMLRKITLGVVEDNAGAYGLYRK